MSTITLIDNAVVASKSDEGHRAHLGASVIGRGCSRQIWYMHHWAKRPEFEGRIYRLFDRGHREEPALVAYLKQAGITVHDANPETGEQFRVSDLGGHFGGSMDGCGIGFPERPDVWHVLEFKTHGDKSFKALAKAGVQVSKPEHYAQMQVYMHYTSMLHACYIAVNKNDDHLHVEFVKYDEAAALSTIEKARMIIEAPTPPERIGGPDWFVCRFCDFREICHQAEIPERNCRTCIHSDPVMTGTSGKWSCAAGNEMGDGREPLPCHRLNPKMFNTTVVGVDGGDIDHGRFIDTGPGSEKV